jgi:molybdopterin-guanine dinucleotide biosynthesis protein A
MPCIGVVLAGGKSSRMGEDKALLKLANGNTLLQQSIHLLQTAGIEEVVVSGDRDGGMADQISGLGPLSAIETVIHKTHAERLLIIPVDMPLLTKTILKQLLNKGDDENSVYFKQHFLPLNLAVTVKTKKIIRHLIEQPDKKSRSLKNLLEKIPTKVLPFKKQHTVALENINTPEQWQKLKSELDHAS